MVSFRAHFPRDYPQTPPTLLLTDELVHPNWKYPARGLEIPHLTKEAWNPSMTIPKVRKGCSHVSLGVPPRFGGDGLASQDDIHHMGQMGHMGHMGGVGSSRLAEGVEVWLS